MRMTRNIFEKLCSDYAYLYIVRLYNETEEFYKIGITSKETIISRFDLIPYEYDIIYLYKHKDSSFIMDLETKLLSLGDKHKPNIYFQGESECVSNIAQIEEFLKTLNWIKGLTEHFIEEARDNKQILKQKLGSSNFSEICKIYIEALKNNDKESIEFIEAYDEIFIIARTEFGVSNISDHLSAISYQRHRLESRLNIQKACNNSQLIDNIKTSFTIGQTYSKNQIKKKIQNVYNKENVKKTATAAQIQNYFEVKSTTNSKGESCFKIIRKL